MSNFWNESWNEIYKTIKELAELVCKQVDDLIGIGVHQSIFIRYLQNINRILAAGT